MSLHPQSLRGRPSSGLSGDIDYRLARNAVVSDLKRGRMSRLDVCDAQPELLRAARNVGTSTGEDCPICEEAKVVLVSFAFGPRLPACGRCLATAAASKWLIGASSVRVESSEPDSAGGGGNNPRH